MVFKDKLAKSKRKSYPPLIKNSILIRKAANCQSGKKYAGVEADYKCGTTGELKKSNRNDNNNNNISDFVVDKKKKKLDPVVRGIMRCK